MNVLSKCAFCVFLLLGLLRNTAAQSYTLRPQEPDLSKPALFSDLPDSILLDTIQLHHLTKLPGGSVVRIALTPQLILQGIVISAAQSQDPLQHSVVIRLTNRPGGVFTLSRIEEAPGKSLFIGRVLSRRHLDALEIITNQEKYVLVKRTVYDLQED